METKYYDLNTNTDIDITNIVSLFVVFHLVQSRAPQGVYLETHQLFQRAGPVMGECYRPNNDGIIYG